MTIIVTRSGKGSALTWSELDANFTNLQTTADAANTQGANVASAATIDLSTSPDQFVHITGAVAITAITLPQGNKRTVVFDGAPTLTNSPSLILPGGANIVAAAGDSAILVGEAAGVVRCVSYQKASGRAPVSKLAQIVSFQTGAVATGTTQLSNANVIPTNVQGDQYLAQAITPTNVNSTLEIDVEINFSNNAAGACNLQAALYQDAIANALSGISQVQPNPNYIQNLKFKHIMPAGTVAATTFKVRAGANVAGTTTLNGQSGTGTLGGIMASRITIKEWLP